MRTILALLLATVLVACAAKTPPPMPPTDPCASMPGDDVVDGGIGGTGKGATVECGDPVS